MRVQATAGAEQQARGALRFHAGGAGGRVDAQRTGDDGVDHLHDGRAGPQHLGIEQDVGAVEHTANRHPQQGLAFRDHAGDRGEIVEIGVTRLERADDRRVRAEFVETRGRFGRGCRDRGEVAELDAAQRVALAQLAGVAQLAQARDGGRIELEPRMQADLHAGVGAVLGILDKIEARLTELLLRLEQPVKLGAGGVGAHDDGRVVARRALRVVLKPVARLGRDHLLVVRGEQADGRRAAHAAREHGLGGPHEDVIRLDGTQAAAGGALHDVLDAGEGMEQRLGAGRFAAGGPQWRPRRTDGRIIEDDAAALDRRQHQLMQRVGPALDRVRNEKGRDGGVEAQRRQHGEFLHVGLLH